MNRFETERQAKEYLVGRIVAEAKHEGIPLTEIERKMLYFSETGWTLPNMLEVNAEFERDYDNDEYEHKIAGLVRKIEASDAAQNNEEHAKWDDAVVKLSEGDHYLLVLVDPNLTSRGSTKRPPGDFRRLILTALACSFGLVLMFFLFEHFFPEVLQ